MAYGGDEELELEHLSDKDYEDDEDDYDWDDDEDFSPLDETVKSHQNFGYETPKTSTGRETFRPKKFKEKESKWGALKTPQLEKNISNAWKTIKENFPNLAVSKEEEINVNINESDEITVKIGDRKNAAEHILFDDDGELNENIPQRIKDILGEQISKKGLREQILIVKGKKEKTKKKLKKMKELIKEKNDVIKEINDEI